jgi:pre-mRNA-splicing helicase BRR2
MFDDYFFFQNAKDDRACERKLVELLGFDHFDIIKVLRDNRRMIYYCTKLKQANPEERAQIEEEIMRQPEFHYILKELRGGDEKEDAVMVGFLSTLNEILTFQFSDRRREA